MNIPKAIEILRAKAIRANQAEDFEYEDALQLGIEALKQIKINRGKAWVPPEMRLPGETKD